jgi:hypothetical protein
MTETNSGNDIDRRCLIKSGAIGAVVIGFAPSTAFPRSSGDALARVRALAQQLTTPPCAESKLIWAAWLERKRIGRELQTMLGDEPEPWEPWELGNGLE